MSKILRREIAAYRYARRVGHPRRIARREYLRIRSDYLDFLSRVDAIAA